MGKVNKSESKTRSPTHRIAPFPMSSLVIQKKKRSKKSSTKKYWEEATCSVCMEVPHNAVLLLCSSHERGCRPFMCATSYHHSNCLEQYKKAYTKTNTSQDEPVSHGSFEDSNFTSALGCADGKTEVTKFLCPLCRGQVKGWTVVEPARKYLNTKKRTCMQDDCSFLGSYKELRKHVRAEHPWARPREVDPTLAEKWKKLENDRELDDVFSTIRSTMPGAVVMGDYVIERNYRSFSRDYVDEYFGDALLGLERYGHNRNSHMPSQGVSAPDYDLLDDEDFGFNQVDVGASAGRVDNFLPQLARYHMRLLLGRSRRRRRHRTGHRAR